MSGPYNGGLRNLNVLPPAEDPDADAFNPDDLAIFTNTRFYDFDMGPKPEQRRARSSNQQEDDPEDPLAEGELIDPNLKAGDMDFLNDYDPFGYASFSLNDIPHSPANLHDHMSTTTSVSFADNPGSMTTPHSAAAGDSYQPAPPPPPPPPPAPLSDSASPSPFPTSSSRSARVRKASTASSSEHAVHSPTSGDNFGFGGDGSESGSKGPGADEDKRRRNTAASARFRVKKKQREQELEKRAKEGEEKVKELETRIKQLQTENTWLKDLLMEKNTSKEPAAPSLKYNAGAKDGVGTGDK